MKRFVAVFCAEDCTIEKTEIKIDVGGLEEFSLKGTVIVTPGWTKYDEFSKHDKILPNLKKGDVVETMFAPKEKETSPPKKHTIETLNNYLKNPFREEQSAAAEAEKAEKELGVDTGNDEEDYRAIFEGLELGTEATRTGIIENAIKSKYISLKKDVYTILPDGENLIVSLSRMGITMDKYKTSYLGQALKKVYKGEITVKDSILLTQNEINRVFNKSEVPYEKDADDGFIGDNVGVCPLCGGNVVRTKFGYGCDGYKDGCKFSVNNVILDRVISLSHMKMLLETGKTGKIDGFISKKSGKPNSKPILYIVCNLSLFTSRNLVKSHFLQEKPYISRFEIINAQPKEEITSLPPSVRVPSRGLPMPAVNPGGMSIIISEKPELKAQKRPSISVVLK